MEILAETIVRTMTGTIPQWPAAPLLLPPKDIRPVDTLTRSRLPTARRRSPERTTATITGQGQTITAIRMVALKGVEGRQGEAHLLVITIVHMTATRRTVWTDRSLLGEGLLLGLLAMDTRSGLMCLAPVGEGEGEEAVLLIRITGRRPAEEAEAEADIIRETTSTVEGPVEQGEGPSRALTKITEGPGRLARLDINQEATIAHKGSRFEVVEEEEEEEVVAAGAGAERATSGSRSQHCLDGAAYLGGEQRSLSSAKSFIPLCIE